MFKVESQVSFDSNKSEEEILKTIERELEDMGTVEVSRAGGIKISSTKFNSLLHRTDIEGRHKERDGRYIVELSADAKLNGLGWLLVVLGFLIALMGLLILIIPWMGTKNALQKFEYKLNEIKAINRSN